LSLPLAVSGVVAAWGWSLILREASRGSIILIEAAAGLPFALRSAQSALAQLPPAPRLAARTLGAGSVRAILEVELAAAAPALLAAFGFSFAIAAGDATTPLLVGLSGFQPLPLLIYRLVGAYRFPEAAAAGLILAVLVGTVFFLKDGSDA
jgi:thiamine transport system permease protein